MRESSSELWDALREVMGSRLVTTNEMRLLELIRTMLQGVDVDLTEDDEFMQAVTQNMARIFKREVERSKARTDLARRHTRPGPRTDVPRPSLSSVKAPSELDTDE